VVTQRRGGLTVINPMEDTPGFRAGILPGDSLIFAIKILDAA